MSARVVKVPLEEVVKSAELIVLAKPRTKPVFKDTEIPKAEHKYKWSLQDFEIVEIYKTGKKPVKIADTLTVSSFDQKSFKLELMHASGIHKIAMYDKYFSNEQTDVQKMGPRILFLKEWTTEQYRPYNAFVYSIEDGYDAPINIDKVKEAFRKGFKKFF